MCLSIDDLFILISNKTKKSRFRPVYFNLAIKLNESKIKLK